MGALSGLGCGLLNQESSCSNRVSSKQKSKNVLHIVLYLTIRNNTEQKRAVTLSESFCLLKSGEKQVMGDSTYYWGKKIIRNVFYSTMYTIVISTWRNIQEWQSRISVQGCKYSLRELKNLLISTTEPELWKKWMKIVSLGEQWICRKAFVALKTVLKGCMCLARQTRAGLCKASTSLLQKCHLKKIIIKL